MNEFALIALLLSLGGYGMLMSIHLIRTQKHYDYDQWKIQNYYNMRFLTVMGRRDEWDKIDAKAKKQLGITEY